MMTKSVTGCRSETCRAVVVHACRASLAAVWLFAATAAAAAVEVEIVGIEGELAANVRAYLSIDDIEEDSDTDGDPDNADNADDADDADNAAERRVQRAHANSRAEIVAALRPFGFYSPVIASSLSPTEEGWLARYEIDSGQATRLDEVDIVVTGEGRDDAPVRDARQSIVESGEILRHSRYESDKSRLFDSAYNSGYIDAAFTRAQLVVRPDRREADVHLHLDTGPRYYFGDINIEQDILNEDFVRHFVTIEAGDPFEPDRLIDLQLALGDSGYFQDVNIAVLREQAEERRIPIVARTTPRPNQSFSVGAGYGTDTGARARLGVELRRLNRKGHRFQADLRASARENSVVGEYRIPAGDLTTDYISYRASLGQEEIGDFDTEQVSLGASWNDVWRELQRSVYIEARREDFAVADADEQSEQALYAGIRLTGKQSDDPLFTRRGHAWSADIRGGSKELAGSATFTRLRMEGSYVHPLGPRGRLLLRGEYGAIHTRDFARIIPSQRFFTGGDNSVRGYEFESLGPSNADGAIVGGRYLAVASIEFDYLFYGNFGGAVFYDVGNASNDPMPDFKRGAGIGFRWRSPVGMVRIDFAHPLDDPETDFRLHLTIGATL